MRGGIGRTETIAIPSDDIDGSTGTEVGAGAVRGDATATGLAIGHLAGDQIRASGAHGTNQSDGEVAVPSQTGGSGGIVTAATAEVQTGQIAGDGTQAASVTDRSRLYDAAVRLPKAV